MVDERDLEQRLLQLRPYLNYPRTPNLVVAVRARIVAAPRRPWWAMLLTPRRLALAAAAVLIVIGGLLAVPQTRDTIAHWFGVKGLIVNTVPSLPAGLGHDLKLGQRTTLDGAKRAVHFEVLVPTDPSLGQPDEVYLNRAVSTGEVSLVYRTRPGLPTSSKSDVAILVMEIQATTEKFGFQKMLGPDATLTEVTVNGGPGYWIAGSPHAFFYSDPSGGFHDEEMRLATNTLVWQQGDRTLRIEGAATEAQALQIAASMK